MSALKPFYIRIKTHTIWNWHILEQPVHVGDEAQVPIEPKQNRRPCPTRFPVKLDLTAEGNRVLVYDEGYMRWDFNDASADGAT